MCIDKTLTKNNLDVNLCMLHIFLCSNLWMCTYSPMHWSIQQMGEKKNPLRIPNASEKESMKNAQSITSNLVMKLIISRFQGEIQIDRIPNSDLSTFCSFSFLFHNTDSKLCMHAKMQMNTVMSGHGKGLPATVPNNNTQHSHSTFKCSKCYIYMILLSYNNLVR